MLTSRLDVALQQSLDRLMAITSSTAVVSLASPIYSTQYNDWRLFKADAYAVPPMPDCLQGVIRDIVALLDARADMSLVRDPKTDEIIRDTLNELLNRAPLSSSSAANAANAFDGQLSAALGNSNNSSSHPMMGAGGGFHQHQSPHQLQQQQNGVLGRSNSYGGLNNSLNNNNNGNRYGGPANSPPHSGGNNALARQHGSQQQQQQQQGGANNGSSPSTAATDNNGSPTGDDPNNNTINNNAVNPIEASIHLCDAIYDIQYSDAATRHTRLCRHLIYIMTLSTQEQHIRFAACVYRKILKSVAMAQKASQLKRKAHVGQGRLAQMNEASQQFLNNSKDPHHTAATGMELAKLNIVNVWEDLAKDIKELCENTLRQHAGGHHHHLRHGAGGLHHHHSSPSMGGMGMGGGGGMSSNNNTNANGGGPSANNAITNLNMNGASMSHQRSPAQALGLLSIIQNTFPYLPVNCSVFHAQHQFRASILAVVAVLAGSSEPYVRMAASDCLGIVLTKHIKPSDVQTETNQLFEMLSRNLKQGNCPESVAVGVCVTMKALLSLRGPPMAASAMARLSSKNATPSFAAASSAAASNSGVPQMMLTQSPPMVPSKMNAPPPMAGGVTSPNATPAVTSSSSSTPPAAGTAAGAAGPSSVKATFEHGPVLGFCSAAIELHRNTRQPSVKSALSALFPFLARIDPQFENRKSGYIDAIIEPLKNIREMDKKAQELYNFYAFLQTIGEYDDLKHETRVNFEAVLLRLLTSSVTPNQTGDTLPDTAAGMQQLMLPTACWYIIGAMFKYRTATNLHTLIERDCLMLIQHTILTSGMIEATKLIREGTAPFIQKLEGLIHVRAKSVLLHTAQLINNAASPSSSSSANKQPSNNNNTNGGASVSPSNADSANSPPPATGTSPTTRSPTSSSGKGNIFSTWFGGNGSAQRTSSGQSQQQQQQNNGQQQQQNDAASVSTAGSPNNNAQQQARARPHISALYRPAHIDEVTAAMDIFSKQQSFVTFYARNGGANDGPDVVAYNYWREMNIVMLPLLAHPVALVRAQCGRLLGHLFRMTIIRAFPIFGQNARGFGGGAHHNNNGGAGGRRQSVSMTNSPHVAPMNPLAPAGGGNGNTRDPLALFMNGVPITLYARAGLVPFLTAFSRRIVFEVDTRVKVALLHSISGGTSGMLIPGQSQFPTVHSELVPQDVIECFSSLLNHVRRVREASVEVLLGVGGSTGVPSARANESLRKNVAMHIKAVSHLQDPHQIASSCSTLTLLFEHRPTLLTTDILSTLMHASCNKLKQLYQSSLANSLLGGLASGGADGGDAHGSLGELQGLGIYDSQAKHRAMLSVQEGEEFVRHTGYATAHGNLQHQMGGGGGGASTNASMLMASFHHDGLSSPNASFPMSNSSGGHKDGGNTAKAHHHNSNGVAITVGVMNAIAMESALTIVLLELINQLLIAGKMIQRQILATTASNNSAGTPPMGAAESPNTRGSGKGFPTSSATVGAGGGNDPHHRSGRAPPPQPLVPSPGYVPVPASPVLALTESSETRSVLQTLWICLLHSSRTISIVTSTSTSSSSADSPHGHNGHSAGSSHHHHHNGGAVSSGNANGGNSNSSGGRGDGNGNGVSMDAQLVQIANAITIQHQALYALTDLLTLAPQNIIDFAHKTALVEYLRNEYLRCSGQQTQSSYSAAQHQRNRGRDGQPVGGGPNAASNALLAIASASKNERHRRTIIRLFALMGAIDPAKGGFGKNTTSDATSIVVEGTVVGNHASGSGKKNGNANGGGSGNGGGMGKNNGNGGGGNNNTNNGGAGGGDLVPKTSARSRDLILRNMQDLRRETYQFCGEANYPLTVYRMIAKLIAEPEGVSDQALDASLKVSLHLFTDPANEKILGWDLLEAMMELVRCPWRVSKQIRLQALNLLPLMIRHRSGVAGQLVREFFSCVLSCWDPSNEQTFLPLLAIIEELHVINLKSAERYSSCMSFEPSSSGSGDGGNASNSNSLPFALSAANNEVDDVSGGDSLYLRLVDVAMRDRSPTRDISHKIISILRLVENQPLVAPVIVNSLVDYMFTHHQEMPLDLRVDLLKMLLTLTYRFGILNCITPIISLVGYLLDDISHCQHQLPPQQPISIVQLRELSANIELILGKRLLIANNDHSAQQDRFSTAGSSVHTRAIEVHRQCRKVLQRAAVLYAHSNGIPCYENGLMTVTINNATGAVHPGGNANGYPNSTEKVVHVLDYVLTTLNNNANSNKAGGNLPHSSSSGRVDGPAANNNGANNNNNSSANDANPLDVIVLHINKAYNGMKRGASFEWTQWFVSFQQHVLLHCPNVALRMCYDLFNLHEPLRKTLFYPAFHCLLVTVLHAATTAAFISGENDPHVQMQRSVAHAIGSPLRRVLTALLRYGDSESVDMCLGLHDYLEHFRNPNPLDSTSSSNALGAMFTAATPNRFEDEDEDGAARGGCTLPTIQSQRQLSTTLRRTAQAQSLNAASSLPPLAANELEGSTRSGKGGNNTKSASFTNLLADAAKKAAAKAPVSPTRAEDEEFARAIAAEEKARRGGGGANANQQQQPPSGSTTPPSGAAPNNKNGTAGSGSEARNLPWSLFRAEDLIRAALEHRLHYKAVRYLESDYPHAIKPGSRNPRIQPGRGISNGPLKSMAAIPAIKGLPQVNPKAAIGRANRLPATSANAVGVVNALALQYSRVNMQSSVEGLYNSVHVGVDATGYELLQWWPEANNVYKKKIYQYERDAKEWQAFKAQQKSNSSNNGNLTPSGGNAPAPFTTSVPVSGGGGGTANNNSMLSVPNLHDAIKNNASFGDESPFNSATNFSAPHFATGAGAGGPHLTPLVGPLPTTGDDMPEINMLNHQMNNNSIANAAGSPNTSIAMLSKQVESNETSRRQSPFHAGVPMEPRSVSPFSPLTPTKGDFGPMLAHHSSHHYNLNNSGVFSNGSQQFLSVSNNPLTQQQQQPQVPKQAPVLRTKDIEGYLRTLCFCGAWDEGLSFAREKFSLLKEACNSYDPTVSHSRGGRSNATTKDETKKANMSRISTADSAVMCASLCAIIMNQWDDVKRFSDLMIDNTNRLLFTQIFLARNEIATFGTNSRTSSPYGSFVPTLGGAMGMLGPNGSPLQDLDNIQPTVPAPALLLEIENNLARALVSVDKELKTVMPMGYTHSYEIIAKLQHFQEIEEARLYRRRDSSSALQNNIKHMWFQRFQCMRPDAVSMLTSIVIYSLAAAPHDIPEAVYHFSKAVRQTHPQLGTWAMSSLQADVLQPNTRVERTDSLVRRNNSFVGSDGGGSGALHRAPSNPSTPVSASIALVNPQQRGDVQVDYCEYLWNAGGVVQRERAIDGLKAFLSSSDAIETTTLSHPSHLIHQTGLQHLGRAHLLLGQWKQESSPDRFWKRENREEILRHLNESIHMVPQEYFTWHTWALMNYRVQQRDVYLKPEERRLYMERAHRGFVAAICRSDRPKVVIQDIMRLLQLWIIYGGVEVLGEAVADGIHRISASLWASCTPQVVAHLGNEHPPIWAVVRSVLEKTLFSFPQLCVFQLLVPILSDPEGVGSKLKPSRARMLLNIACPEALSTEARAVAEGLVQLAMFPLEFIRDRIGQGLKIFRSVEPPVAALEIEAIRIPCHQALVMSREQADSLAQVGPVYQVIEELLRLLGGNGERDFHDARSYCERLYNELQDHVKELKSISLQQCTSPKLALAALRNLSIWVPGEYTPQRKTAPTIYGFVDRVEVLESKRRPRRMHIVGSDGNISTYCLKGNEDVRVDARAMQLFWLVNSFSATTELQPISRFPVIPLTEDCGLLGWVHESETLYNTIRTFRTRAGIRNDPEMDVINREFTSPSNINKIAQLMIPQRADLFEHLYDSVESKDMAHVLWYRSVNAELWLKRRTCFTTSLATMSTAGYILGLGDRHPGNLLLQMATGAVVHIDFGDCFDVARYRSSFPETVPFRLTPMLVNAMEVFGVSGAFQATCEASMASMRTNRDSIVALLSAFVYDPVMDKRISQHHGGNVLGVIDQVRRKLRGMEMPAYYYKQNSQSTSWKQPAMSEATGRPNLKTQLSPAKRGPSSGFLAGNVDANANGLVGKQLNSPTTAYGPGGTTTTITVTNTMNNNNNTMTTMTDNGLYSVAGGANNNNTSNDATPTAMTSGLFPAVVSADGQTVSQHLPQHTIDPDADEVMHAVLAAGGNEAALALDLALDHDNNDNESTNAPTKREAAVRGEEHITWALQPRPDLPFVLSQASSERAMKIAGVPRESLSVKDQVRILINESTKAENLSALFAGWTAWW